MLKLVIYKKTILIFGTLFLILYPCQKLEQSSQSKLNNKAIIKSQTTVTNVNENHTKLATILQDSNLLKKAKEWQFKALFIQVIQDKYSQPILNYYYYQSVYEDINNNQIQDSEDIGFFNPASTIKVGLSIVTLEKLSSLNLGRDTEYRIAGNLQWYSIQEDIKKALVISDNEASNRLILFLGFNYLNSRMQALGFNSYSVNRLMLNKGTLVDSPAFELKFQGKIIQQLPQKTSKQLNCFETQEKIGNCANAKDLAEILIRLINPEFYQSDHQFTLREDDRIWLQEVMSKTPKESGFNYENTFCRFLDPLENKIANQTGKLLSKCGVGLFSHTFVDTSFIETNEGQKYYIVMVLTPPSKISKPEAINWMNDVSELILNKLN